MILYCATTNPGKLREFQLAAGQLEIRAFDTATPCEETGGTFEENAILKAAHYSVLAPGLLFCDDSGLEVDALGGAPGVRSARYAGNDADNNSLLLENLRGARDRSARFVCVIALAGHGRLIGTFRGAVEGVILEEPRGTSGFGYDPLFYYPPLGCTFAELAAEQKMKVSHRAQAVREMMKRLKHQEQR